MEDRLASRSARNYLLRVIALMIVPAAILWTMYFLQARKEIKFIEREQLGLQLAKLTYPALLGVESKPSENTLQQIVHLERQLGIRPGEDFIAVWDKRGANTDMFGSRGNVAPIAGTIGAELDLSFAHYLDSIATESGLILDSDTESYFLSSAILAHLPNAIFQINAAQQNLSTVAREALISHEKLLHLMRAVGKAGEASSHVTQALWRAKRESKTPYAYEQLGKNFKVITSRIAEMDAVLLGAAKNLGETKLKSYASEMSGSVAVQANAILVSKQSLQLLEARLEERRGLLLRNFMVLTALGLMFVLTGISLALKMIRKTLVKLDLVDEARASAERATAEAQRVNDEIANLNTELANRLHELKSAQDELVKKGRMEQLGQLTATIAHELRNPLGAVRTSTFLLEKKMAGLGLGLESQIERINKGVLRCDDIITQLLDYSRSRVVSPSHADFDEWVVKTVREHATRLPQAIEIECALGLDGKLIQFDSARMERAVINLLNNASEAMVGDGSDPAKYTTPNPKISVSTGMADGHAYLQVKDNGPGMEMDVLARVREPLFTTKSFGTGLGIPAIEQIAQQHGGNLQIESKPGEGACFRICIPLSQGGRAAA